MLPRAADVRDTGSAAGSSSSSSDGGTGQFLVSAVLERICYGNSGPYSTTFPGGSRRRRRSSTTLSSNIPPPLSNVIVADRRFGGLTVDGFHEMFLADGAPHSMEEFHVLRGDMDVSFEPWQKRSDVEATSGGGGSALPQHELLLPCCAAEYTAREGYQERRVSFRTPVKVSSAVPYLAPRSTEVAIHQRLVKSRDALVLEAELRLLDVPYADRFYVLSRTVVRANPAPRLSLADEDASVSTIDLALPDVRRGACGQHCIPGSGVSVGVGSGATCFPGSSSDSGRRRGRQRQNSLGDVILEAGEKAGEMVRRLVLDDGNSEPKRPLALLRDDPADAVGVVLRTEFEVRFIRPCQFEHRIRNGLTKKMTKLWSAWCDGATEQWEEAQRIGKSLPWLSDGDHRSLSERLFRRDNSMSPWISESSLHDGEGESEAMEGCWWPRWQPLLYHCDGRDDLELLWMYTEDCSIERQDVSERERDMEIMTWLRKDGLCSMCSTVEDSNKKVFSPGGSSHSGCGVEVRMRETDYDNEAAEHSSFEQASSLLSSSESSCRASLRGVEVIYATGPTDTGLPPFHPTSSSIFKADCGLSLRKQEVHGARGKILHRKTSMLNKLTKKKGGGASVTPLPSAESGTE